MNDDTSDRLTVMLAEYNTLRAESLQSISQSTQTLSFGYATIAALAGGTLAFASETMADKHELIFGVFTLAIPPLCLTTMYMWLGEIERMLRAGSYIGTIEKRINRLLGSPEALRWEHRELRRFGSHRATQLRYPYASALLSLTLTAVLSGAAPFFLIGHTRPNVLTWLIVTTTSLGAAYHASSRLRNANTKWAIRPVPRPSPSSRSKGPSAPPE